MFIGYGLGISQICTDYRSDTRVELFCEKSENISKAKIVLMFLQNGEFNCVEPFHFRKKESLRCENTTEDLGILWKFLLRIRQGLTKDCIRTI